MFKKEIILASGSPRRQQFFKDMGIPYSIDVREVIENYPSDLKAEGITNYLANLKADAFTDIKDNQVVITSDTLVWHNEIALGKPSNNEDAFKMLKSLSNVTHKVITSVCFKTKENKVTIFETTEVTFGYLTDEMINYYIQNYNPLDKAGAYGIQEWIGEVGILKINGSYTNVVGLPVAKVFKYLNENFK